MALGCGSCYSVLFLLTKHFHHYVGCEKLVPHLLVVLLRVMLGPVIGIVELAWSPVNAKLLLTLAVTKPVETHVHGFGALRLHFAIDDPVCHGIVRLQRRGGLFVP